MQQIDSALTVPIRLQIDTIAWTKMDTVFNNINKIKNKVSYAPAYYIFMGERVKCTVDYKKRLKSRNILTAEQKNEQKDTRHSFYKKIKGTLPRQTISNIECFELPEFK